MSSKFIFFIFLFLFFIPEENFSQQASDQRQVNLILNSKRPDTAKVELLLAKGNALLKTEKTRKTDEILAFASAAESLADKINYFNGLIRSYALLAKVYRMKGDKTKARYYANKALQLNAKLFKIKDKELSDLQKENEEQEKELDKLSQANAEKKVELTKKDQQLSQKDSALFEQMMETRKMEAEKKLLEQEKELQNQLQQAGNSL